MTKKNRPKHDAVAHEGSDYEVSLSKLVGKKVVDLIGYPSSEFGKDVPVFKVTEVIFEDGTSDRLEGEHDIPYIPTGGSKPILTEEMLNALLLEEEGG